MLKFAVYLACVISACLGIAACIRSKHIEYEHEKLGTSGNPCLPDGTCIVSRLMCGMIDAEHGPRCYPKLEWQPDIPQQSNREHEL